jgi:hypothetical protein
VIFAFVFLHLAKTTTQKYPDTAAHFLHKG